MLVLTRRFPLPISSGPIEALVVLTNTAPLTFFSAANQQRPH